MPLVFPNNPTNGQVYSSGSSAQYQYNGSYWEVVMPRVLISASYAITASHLIPSTDEFLWADQKHSAHQWGANFAFKNKIFAVGSNYSYRTTAVANNTDKTGMIYEVPILQRPVSFSKLVVNPNNVYALGDNGVAYSYGVNNYGQLGNGTNANVFMRPMAPITSSRISGSGIQVLDIYGANNAVNSQTDGNYASIICKVNDNGTLKYFGFGANDYAQLGIGNTTAIISVPTENTVMRGKNIVSMSMGSFNAASVLALVDDGTVWSWGYNNVGQLGVGNQTLGTNPTQAKSGSGLVPITNAIDVQSCYMTDESSFNWYNTYILKADGTVLGAGNGGDYLRGDGQNSTSPFYFTDVRTSATTKLQNIVKIFCKGYTRMALDSSGNLWAWGRNYWGAWGDPTKAENAFNQWATIIATGVQDVSIDACTSRISRIYIKQNGVWYSSGYNNDYSCIIGYRDGDNVNPRKQMALPFGKEIKRWIPVGNYAGSSAIGGIMFQTTDNHYYMAGYLDYILGNGSEYSAGSVNIDFKFKDLLS